MSLSQWSFDLAYAWKGVRGGQGASLAAVLALGLGIGASVTAAAVGYAGLLGPLPFADSRRLVELSKNFVPTARGSGVKLSEFDRWRTQMAGTATLAASASERVVIRTADGPQEARVLCRRTV